MAIGAKALTFAPPVLPIGRQPTRWPNGTSASRNLWPLAVAPIVIIISIWPSYVRLEGEASESCKLDRLSANFNCLRHLAHKDPAGVWQTRMRRCRDGANQLVGHFISTYEVQLVFGDDGFG